MIGGSGGNIRKAFENVCLTLGWHDVTPHTLRHTFVNQGLAMELDPAELADLVGMSLETLINNYRHAALPRRRSAMSKFSYAR